MPQASTKAFVALAIVQLLVPLLVPSQVVVADDEIFDIQEILLEDRTITAELADFNGDAQKDLMVAAVDGIPPQETRQILVYLRNAEGLLPDHPNHAIPLPPWSAVYDIADLKDTPGDELILLRPDGVSILSLSDARGLQWDLPVDGPSTVAAADDERGFDPFRLVYPEFAAEPWILIPQIGSVTALTADGRKVAELDVARRANYFVVPKTSPFAAESDIQLFLDVPKLGVGDVNGNGMIDIVTATRHELRVFLRLEDGSYPRQASFVLPLGLVSSQDHIRGSGSVVTTMKDVDGDTLLDLLISHIEGGFSDATTTTYLHLNKGTGWDLDAPDDQLVSNGVLVSDLLVDFDQDNRLELLRISLKFSLLEIVELLLTQEIDARVAVHRLQADGKFGEKPWAQRKIGTKISFDTFRPRGFTPPMGIDINADGFMDLITSKDGKGIAIYPGGGKNIFARRSVLQSFPSAGRIRFADFNNDDLPDFVLFNSGGGGESVRVGRNLGRIEAQQ
jgi:hypothetical protein